MSHLAHPLATALYDDGILIMYWVEPKVFKIHDLKKSTLSPNLLKLEIYRILQKCQ